MCGTYVVGHTGDTVKCKQIRPKQISLYEKFPNAHAAKLRVSSQMLHPT